MLNRIKNYVGIKLKEYNINASFTFDDLEGSAYAMLSNDKSEITFNSFMLDEDFPKFLEEALNISLEGFVDSVLAHELGHYEDPNLEIIQEEIESIFHRFGYCSDLFNLIIKREETAYRLGKQFSLHPEFYEVLNQDNIQVYKDLIKDFEEVA